MIATRELTPEEVEHLGHLQSLTHDELVDLACEGDEMAQVLVTSESSDFATVHAAAAKMNEVMTQTFRVRIKSVPSQLLSSSLHHLIKLDFAKMGGKFFDCKIDWEMSKVLGRLYVTVDGGEFHDYGFAEEDLTKLTTVRKMKALYEYIKTTNQW